MINLTLIISLIIAICLTFYMWVTQNVNNLDEEELQEFKNKVRDLEKNMDSLGEYYNETTKKLNTDFPKFRDKMDVVNKKLDILIKEVLRILG